MALPVWVVPAAKAVGKYVVTNAGPTLVQMTKKYGPVALRGYREHGLKPKKIFEFVLDEVAPKQSASESAVSATSTRKR